MLMRPFLDFNDEEELLRETRQYEKSIDKGVEKEIAEDYIIKTYRLSKRKEHAFIETLTDDNIRIFCGDILPEKVDEMQAAKNDRNKKQKKENHNTEGGIGSGKPPIHRMQSVIS